MDAQHIKVAKSTQTLSEGQTAYVTILTYPSLDPNAHANTMEDVGVVATGSHVELTTLVYDTQDYMPDWILGTLEASLPNLQK